MTAARTVPAWLTQLRAAVLRHIAAERSSQAALAAHLGITPKHMSQMLTGRVAGSAEMLDRIAIVVGDREPAPLPPRAPGGRPAGRLPKSARTG